MKQNVSKHSFIRAFEQAGRADQFSRAGLIALFDYLEDLEQDLGEEMELDVIALCCEWTEHSSATDAADQYTWDKPEREDDEDDDEYQDRIEQEALEWLQGQTHVVDVDGGAVLVLQF